jgi:two-component system, OmpR family, phosphate regulon response regulator PhoB
MKKILMIDDHAQTRQLVKWALADSGYQLYEASNGDSGLKIADHVKPDLIVLDVVMPGELDGIKVCEQIRASPSLSAIKIILLSANDQPKDREQGQLAGANAYLAKPFKPAALRSLIDKLLGS